MMDNQAGPSRPKQPATASVEPKEDVDDPTPAAPKGGAPAQAEEGDEDEERMDFKAIESIASKIQYAEGTGRPKINIPKRGEKDFEPLQETVNLQEMMLQKSREALFNALVGVRGGNSKAMSHALLTPNSIYPKMLITRGHIHDSLGIAVRQPTRFSRQTTVELLPEEALYLLERGSLQIWIGSEPETETDYALGVGTWKDEEYGVKGAVEMSVMEGYGCFIGKEGLTWEKYSAYAYLKRLGYTVQRTPQFIPDYFDPPRLHPTQESLPPFKSWWFSLPRWIGQLLSNLGRRIASVSYSVAKVGMDFSLRWTRAPFRGTLLSNWYGSDHGSIFSHLRITPTGHSQPLPPRPTPASTENIYDALEHNPYLPFYHIWKPATPWSKAKWEKGTEEGLARQKPDYYAAIIETVPMPTIHQLSEVFETLPDEPTGPIKRVGPQYAHRNRPRPTNTQEKEVTWYERIFPFLASKEEAKPYVNPMGALRNGDRALIVAVNDSGNTGWVRFGRTGFAEAAVM